MSEITISDKLPTWMKDHAERYLKSNGADGHMWDSTFAGGKGPIPTLLLTTTGRRSGKPVLLPLIYGETGNSYVVIASKGGAPQHPAWYLNLTAHPEVTLQVAADRFQGNARTVSGAERTKLWEQMVDLYPPYTDYQNKTDREIPVVVIERI
ncbi:MAG: nitroreductase family deazaflavin-dependent oxidoreductase [SAR324 cluster bacterium]|nr:nitroreductase family deazaflavin-dependent oxidoreductase [SAR324 cluster bacterium]